MSYLETVRELVSDLLDTNRVGSVELCETKYPSPRLPHKRSRNRKAVAKVMREDQDGRVYVGDISRRLNGASSHKSISDD